MKTNISLNLSDQQRNDLACLLAGKKVKRLATRKEIVEFTTGLIERNLINAIGVKAIPESPARQALAGALSADEQGLVEHLRAQGKSDSYIRGYIKGGRPGGRI